MLIYLVVLFRTSMANTVTLVSGLLQTVPFLIYPFGIRFHYKLGFLT